LQTGAGTYTVIAGSDSVTMTGSVDVTVNPIPATPSPGSNSAICEGNAINLSTALVSGATYNWTGPNGFTSFAQNPTIAATTTAEGGTYSVTVTENGCTSAAGTTTVVVNTIPATPTASNDGPLCVGSTLNLSTPVVAGATYSWTGPNRFTSSSQNPSIANVTTAAAGTYSVTITLNGC